MHYIIPAGIILCVIAAEILVLSANPHKYWKYSLIPMLSTILVGSIIIFVVLQLRGK
jgi:hypothetical protein